MSIELKEIKHYEDMKKSQANCKILEILKYVKAPNGTRKTMLSVCLPSFEKVGELKSTLESMLRIAKAKYENNLIYEEFKSLDEDRMRDYKYQCLSLKEALGFVCGLKWQEEDIGVMGLIVYFGYIDDAKDDPKKIFHVFPCPKDFVKEINIKQGKRFQLDYLNANPWFVEEFGSIRS